MLSNRLFSSTRMLISSRYELSTPFVSDDGGTLHVWAHSPEGLRCSPLVSRRCDCQSEQPGVCLWGSLVSGCRVGFVLLRGGARVMWLYLSAWKVRTSYIPAGSHHSSNITFHTGTSWVIPWEGLKSGPEFTQNLSVFAMFHLTMFLQGYLMRFMPLMKFSGSYRRSLNWIKCP